MNMSVGACADIISAEGTVPLVHHRRITGILTAGGTFMHKIHTHAAAEIAISVISVVIDRSVDKRRVATLNLYLRPAFLTAAVIYGKAIGSTVEGISVNDLQALGNEYAIERGVSECKCRNASRSLSEICEGKSYIVVDDPSINVVNSVNILYQGIAMIEGLASDRGYTLGNFKLTQR